MTSKGDFIKVQQSKYILIAFLFGLTGAIDYVVKYNIEVYPWGYISALLLIGTIAYAIVRYRLMDIRVAVASTGIFLVVYFVALGVPFQLYRTGEHFLALVMAVILATVAPFIYSRLKNEAEKEILKGELDYQKALTLSIQQQLIESEKMATIGFLVGGLACSFPILRPERWHSIGMSFFRELIVMRRCLIWARLRMAFTPAKRLLTVS